MGEKRKLLLWSIGTSVVSAFLLTVYILYLAIDTNAQQEFCSVTSALTTSAGEVGATYVLEGNKRIVLYDPEIHVDYKVFYVQKPGTEYRIEESDWVSQDRLCKLKKGLVGELFARFFLGLTFCISIGVSVVMFGLRMAVRFARHKSFESLTKE